MTHGDRILIMGQAMLAAHVSTAPLTDQCHAQPCLTDEQPRELTYGRAELAPWTPTLSQQSHLAVQSFQQEAGEGRAWHRRHLAEPRARGSGPLERDSLEMKRTQGTVGWGACLGVPLNETLLAAEPHRRNAAPPKIYPGRS